MNNNIRKEYKAQHEEYKKFVAMTQNDCDKCLGYLSKYLNKRVRVSPMTRIGSESVENNINVQIFNNDTDYRTVTIPYSNITKNEDLGFDESVLKELTEILVKHPERVSKYNASYVEKLLYVYINSLNDFYYWLNNDDRTLCCQTDDNTELICYTEDIKAITFESDGIAKIYLDDEKDSDYEDIDYILLNPDSYSVIKLTQEEQIEKAQSREWYKICQEEDRARQDKIHSIIASKYPNNCPKCGAELALEPNAPHIDDTEYIVCTNFNCNWAREFTEELDTEDLKAFKAESEEYERKEMI
ncbi:MAG: hypothetical protein E7222_09645 [Clostridiales bacterium]|nr:hypothetical protein [Clostridiales bacterium]